MGRYVGHFEIIPRGRRAQPHLASVQAASEQFKRSLSAGDATGMQKASSRAWDALSAIFEILRGEQDDGYLDASQMQVSTGRLVSRATAAEQAAMVAAARIDRTHPDCGPLSLREALNKIAHYTSSVATYRVDRRGAHYLVLGGSQHGRGWVAEMLVSTLVRNARSAAKAIRWHP